MVNAIYNRDVVQIENDGTKWIKCPYCQWHYDSKQTNIDHIIPWREYCMSIIQDQPDLLLTARALEVYIGCNDSANLVVACRWCNASKGDRHVTENWLRNRRIEANRRNGYQ